MISYYDLLTLIKEDKQPDKVKYNGYIYYYDDVQFISYIKEATLLEQFADYEMFNKGIEIIEEKPKRIEKLDCVAFLDNKELDTIAYKVNELIDKVNYLLERDKHE